ncbi:MAG: sigma-70 family RNA polymerase sigma factor [Acidimicrobiaceae bacterium]|nr:sigma-70 family RNA polymerase sigma factor [Acidimicrobiaceae bacterium]MXZ65988.1 sigma-70 family RNA polymerase sigma factor [Acidimicrobiaceae bacterium]MYA13992.1 sigma-70 family RNA polymerase sigma factor [Acidimicrobiaceae bacterium]MYE64311.1 sigma-70 family RNA polymerase sigma factor [Acidimicrobiaceae bacterium]MYF32002.1 sigma-70 family RNA polymerase sigma factor [Acidimicrobiaceae bacterium]
MLKTRSDLDDARLTKAAQAGDRDALETLLRRHQPKIHAICRRLAGNDADGQDATQEALIAIVRGLPRFHGTAKFSTWAYRVATNAALDELRRRSRRPVPAPAETDDRLAAAAAGDDPASVAVRLDLDAALAQLPEEFRAPVVLRDVAGCDYAEIGQILRIPPGTVRSRIARGRARLAEAMSANGGNHHDTPQRRNDEASRP